MIACDTTVFIDLFRGDKQARYIIERTADQLVTTMLNTHELYAGLRGVTKADCAEEEFYRTLLDNMIVLPLTQTALQRAWRLYYTLQKRGVTVGFFDCEITAILLENGMTSILTRNTKHFQHFSELTLISY